MTLHFQLAKESYKNTPTFAYSSLPDSPVSSSARDAILVSPALFAEPPVGGAVELESFIDMLTKDDPDFNNSLVQARKKLSSSISGGSLTVKSLRLKRGLSQADLAKLVGTSQSHIARIEKRPGSILLSTGARLAEALEVNIALLASLAAGTTIEIETAS